MPPFNAHDLSRATPLRQPPTIARTYKGADLSGEFLLTEWSDGTREIAWRGQSWETWSPPIKLEVTA